MKKEATRQNAPKWRVDKVNASFEIGALFFLAQPVIEKAWQFQILHFLCLCTASILGCFFKERKLHELKEILDQIIPLQETGKIAKKTKKVSKARVLRDLQIKPK